MNAKFPTIVHNWNPDQYIKFLEHTKSASFQNYHRIELAYITSKIPPSETKTFIDVGAGYGRVVPQLAKSAKKIIAIENDKNMLQELKRRAKKLNNIEVIDGDANFLEDLLREKDIKNPVFLYLQNTLGTWKGDYKKALQQTRKIGEKENGEIIISIFRQDALEKLWGEFYAPAPELFGEPDLERTDFEKGIFRSKTGYLSKWRTKKEREEIKKLLGGKVVKEILGFSFYILHTSYN